MKNLNQKNESVTIMLKLVGTSCNMKCQYCYGHVSNVKHIGCVDEEVVVEYLSQYKDVRHVFIVFHGGEPLLMGKKTMSVIMKYITENFTGEYHIQIQTNGILINEEWIKLFEKFAPVVSVSISLDPEGKKDLRFGNDYELRKKVFHNIKKVSDRIDNVGVISVIHAYNICGVNDFVRQLIEIGIRSLTINKCQAEKKDKYYITEMQYVDLLKQVFIEWVSNRWYKDINIQPLVSLFSKNKNKLCVYLDDENKCTYFRTFYNENDKSNFCDHLSEKEIPRVQNKCIKCEIYKMCGGGCLAEEKDETFCEARKELFEFIEEVKNGN